jgi:hypothetical protein
MLRASIEHTGADYNLDGVIGDGDGGIPQGGLLIEFAEAAIGGDDARLSAAREQVLKTLGPEALVDAACIVATFNAIDRVADATGTPIDEERLEPTAEMREHLGIDRFPSAATT